jgi:hypothetical protein
MHIFISTYFETYRRLIFYREFSTGYVKDKWQSVVAVTAFRHSSLLGPVIMLMKQG